MIAGVAALLLVLAACASSDETGATSTAAADEETAATTPAESQIADEPASTNPGASDEIEAARAGLDANVAFATSSWPTDWSKSVVELDSIFLGIGATDPRDAIPPIDQPNYESLDAAAEWLQDREPGAVVRVNGEARFFPLSIMTRHEIVNDELGGVPLAITYCPLCNTALAFDRRVDGEVLRFGVSGLLRNSDLVMWDDKTVSLWQQITGEAIVGEHAGTRLQPVSTAIVSFADFRESFPDGLSLSRETGFSISYGVNPYRGYSSSPAPFMPVSGEPDGRFPALERVVGVSVDGVDKAYPFSILSEDRAVNDIVNDVHVAVLWGSPDTADALDGTVIADSQAIGTAIALDRELDGQTLTFSASGEMFTDAETGTTWTILGKAVDGPLEGSQLDTVSHRNEFWFAWSAFFPDAAVFGG